MIKTVAKIDGMMCGMCEAHINDAVRHHFTVKKVTSSQGRKETAIISEEELDEERLRQVIEDTGYELLSVTQEPYKKKGILGLF